MKTTLANDRDIFNHFVGHEALRKLRAHSDLLLGRPIWWASFRPNGNARAFGRSVDASYAIWGDPRVKRFRHSSAVYAAVKKHSHESKPFSFVLPKLGLNLCVPLVAEGRLIGILGLIGLRKGVRQDMLHWVAQDVQTIADNCAKKEELDRLSASIRPRAIALSTVHTVHRIINSTLNLDELISRLAYLTAQVLRSSRCAIYLIEKPAVDTNIPKKPRKKPVPHTLACRALVGYPKHKDKNTRLTIGIGVEGKVAKTAQVALRKKFICIPLIDEDIIGVMTVSHKKEKGGFTYFDQEILTTLAEEAVIAIKNAQLYEEQKRVTLGTIQSLAVILGTKVPAAIEPEAFLRVVLKLAEELKLGEEDTQALHYATLLKDTAKIGIPEEILKKPTKLTGEEYRLLRDHPIKGAKIVQSFESLKSVVPIILYSREKFDGTGYPKGLKGEKIPVGARILSIINAFEAIVMGRPYRDKATLKEALDEILKNRGTQFDPKIVDHFVRIVEKEELHRAIKNAR